MVNFFYGTDSPIFLFDANDDLITLQSSQGPRQGCAAGTHGFCLGLHPLLVKLQSLFPEFQIRALTDDIIPLIPPPASDSFDDWQVVFSRYADFLCALKSLSHEYAELTLNFDKCSLLLPPNAPLPSGEVRSKFPPSFDFQQAGVRIAGSPVGTESYMRAFVDGKIRGAQEGVPLKFSVSRTHVQHIGYLLCVL